MRPVSMMSKGKLPVSVSMHMSRGPRVLILGSRQNCSSDESDSQSEEEVPDQAPQRSASKKVLLAFAICGGSLGKRSLHLPNMLLPQASSRRPANKRKATETPSGSALDAPLLGEQVYMSAHDLLVNCFLSTVFTLQNLSRTTQRPSLRQQRSVNKNFHTHVSGRFHSHMIFRHAPKCCPSYTLNDDVLQDWVNAYQQNRASATAELLTLLTQVH